MILGNFLVKKIYVVSWFMTFYYYFFISGIEYVNYDQVSVRLLGLRKGRTRLHLEVTVPGTVAGSLRSEMKFSDEIIIEIFEELSLISPVAMNGMSILMAPFSTIQLETNLDSLGNVKYR